MPSVVACAASFFEKYMGVATDVILGHRASRFTWQSNVQTLNLFSHVRCFVYIFSPIICESHISLFSHKTIFPFYSYSYSIINSVVHLCCQIKWGESPAIKTHHGWNGKEWPALVGSPLTRSLAHPCVPQWLCLDANLNEKRLNKNERLSEKKMWLAPPMKVEKKVKKQAVHNLVRSSSPQQSSSEMSLVAGGPFLEKTWYKRLFLFRKSLCSYALFKVSKPGSTHTQNEFCRSW